MKNLSAMAKAAAEKLAKTVQNNPDLKKAAERIKGAATESAVEAVTNMARTLHQAASGSKAARPVSPDTDQPTAAGMAASLVKKLPPIRREVSEAQLNQYAAKAITDDGRIKSLRVQCQQDRLTVRGTFSLAGLPLNFTTTLSLQSCELTPTRKVIALRRLDDIALGGDGILASFMAHIVKVIICGLFGVDLAAISLKRIKGLTISKDIITADLEAMGAVDIITTKLREEIRRHIELLPGGPLVKIAVEPMLDAAGPLLLTKLHLQNVAITDKGIRGEMVLLKS